MAARETKPNGKSQLIRDLKNGEFATLYIISGEESYMKEYYLRQLRQKVVDETFADFNLIEFEGKGLTPEMLTEAMKEYPFPAPDGSCEDLQVFLHGLPDEQGRRTYPFICVRWVSGDINEGVDGYIGAEGRETLALVLGMYAPESQEQAGLILAELLDWTRAVLRRNRVVDKKFQLELPLKASIPDPEKQWMEYHMATVFPEYQYIIPSTPLGGTLKEHTYE